MSFRRDATHLLLTRGKRVSHLAAEESLFDVSECAVREGSHLAVEQSLFDVGGGQGPVISSVGAQTKRKPRDPPPGSG